MSYMLDGIETAMTARRVCEGTDYAGWLIDCPCGGQIDGVNRDALRFHYTYCPQAKVRRDHDVPVPNGMRDNDL